MDKLKNLIEYVKMTRNIKKPIDKDIESTHMKKQENELENTIRFFKQLYIELDDYTENGKEIYNKMSVADIIAEIAKNKYEVQDLK